MTRRSFFTKAGLGLAVIAGVLWRDVKPAEAEPVVPLFITPTIKPDTRVLEWVNPARYAGIANYTPPAHALLI